VALFLQLACGTFAFNWHVSLALLARNVLHAGPGGFGGLFAAQGAGALLGALAVARLERGSQRILILSVMLFGVVTVAAAYAPSFTIAALLMVLGGLTSTVFFTTGNVVCQLESDPVKRGRILALNAVAFTGTRPIGGPLLGLFADA